MPRTATKAADNVFYKTRMEAAKWNEKLSSREGAAEVTGLDRTRLASIELETVTPYPEDVLMLADTYNAPELMNHFCSCICPLGRQTVETLEVKGLALATLQLLSSAQSFQSVINDLVSVTDDGVIDESEKQTMANILETLGETSKKIEELKLVVQKIL